jgi:agmatinase
MEPTSAELPVVVEPGRGPTFLDAPLHLDLATLPADIAVLGMRYGAPYGMEGVSSDAANAPAAMRERSVRYGYRRFLNHYDFDFGGPLLDGKEVRIVDCGDVAAHPLDIAGNSRRATQAARRIVEAGAVPIVLGGDDSIPIPFFRAFEGQGPFTVVQIDAHLDFRDELDGVREGFSSPMRRASEMEWVEHIVQVGMRGAGSARPAEVADALAAGNLIVSARELHRDGVESLLERIPAGRDYLITIDVDGLDPSTAPACGSPLPGGVTFDEASDLVRGLAARGRIAGLDVVEMMPSLDVNGITAITAVRLILHAIGAMVRSEQLG